MKYIQPPSSYSVIENFYLEPDKVLSLAKEFPVTGCGPNKTYPLYQLDNNLHRQLLEVFVQLYGGRKPNKDYTLMSFFSQHEMSDIKLLNNGWWRTAGHNPETCRYDDSAENLVYCGIIMLSHAQLDSDFEIGKVKPHLDWDRQKFIDETCNYYTIPKEKFLAGEMSYEEYEKCYYEHENNYYSVFTVKNEFNKLISWRGDVVHREKRTEPLINQYFFLSEWDRK